MPEKAAEDCRTPKRSRELSGRLISRSVFENLARFGEQDAALIAAISWQWMRLGS
jgi:hypothetical protein